MLFRSKMERRVSPEALAKGDLCCVLELPPSPRLRWTGRVVFDQPNFLNKASTFARLRRASSGKPANYWQAVLAKVVPDPKLHNISFLLSVNSKNHPEIRMVFVLFKDFSQFYWQRHGPLLRLCTYEIFTIIWKNH